MPSSTWSARLQSPELLGAAFLASGMVHLVRPQVFRSIMPRFLPESTHGSLIAASGVAELACSAGLLRRRSWARIPSAVVVAAVFPANLQMALDSGTGRNQGWADSRLLAWGRLPLQALLLRMALGSGTT